MLTVCDGDLKVPSALNIGREAEFEEENSAADVLSSGSTERDRNGFGKWILGEQHPVLFEN